MQLALVHNSQELFARRLSSSKERRRKTEGEDGDGRDCEILARLLDEKMTCSDIELEWTLVPVSSVVACSPLLGRQ